MSGLLSEDITTIQGLFQRSAESFGSGDFAGWASLYAEDGVLMPPNRPTVTGRSDVQAFGESFPPVSHLGFSGVEVDGEGDVAVGWSAYELSLKGDDGAEVNDTGKQLAVLKRQADGSWLVSRAMFNSDLAPE